MTGTLYLVPTPIGNLEDITYRAVRILSEVDLIAAEDTRNSIKLLNHLGIKTHMTSYHEHNKIDKAKELVAKLLSGESIAVITDAGCPGISDPGEELVGMCYESGIEVIALPGAAAFVTGLISSGQPTRRFSFEAFLPKDKKKRRAVLDEIETDTRTVILYESPHHLKATLRELYEKLGDREITIARELTKIHEEKLKFKLLDAVLYYEEQDPRGEYVIVIAPKDAAEREAEMRSKWEDISLEEHMDIYESKGIERKEAMKHVAKDRGISKRDVYNELVRK